MKAVKGRKAIVVFTDGVDTSSKFSFDQALSTIKANGVPIYALWQDSIRKGAPANNSASALKELATSAGGQAFFPDSDHEFQAAFGAISAALHPYQIIYQSTGQQQQLQGATARVELVDSQTNEPLRMRDQKGMDIPYHIVVNETP